MTTYRVPSLRGMGQAPERAEVWPVPGSTPREGGGGRGVASLMDCSHLPCRAVGYIMSTMFYPLVTFALLLVCIAYWAIIALYPLPTWLTPPEALGGGGQGNTSAIGRRHPFCPADTALL